MGWGINFNIGEAFSSAADFVGGTIDATLHTASVLVDGVEEGVGTIGGLVVGGVADIANGVVAISGDVISVTGLQTDNWRLYEGGFGTGIGAVSETITEGIDNAQAVLIDAPANWALQGLGVDYQLQLARPPLRSDFDRIVFGTAKTGTEIVAGVAVVAVTGGAGAALMGGSFAATAGAVATGAVTGWGGAATAAGASYGLYANVSDQFEQSRERREMLEGFVDASTPASPAISAPAQGPGGEEFIFNVVDPLAADAAAPQSDAPRPGMR